MKFFSEGKIQISRNIKLDIINEESVYTIISFVIATLLTKLS